MEENEHLCMKEGKYFPERDFLKEEGKLVYPLVHLVEPPHYAETGLLYQGAIKVGGGSSLESALSWLKNIVESLRKGGPSNRAGQ